MRPTTRSPAVFAGSPFTTTTPPSSGITPVSGRMLAPCVDTTNVPGPLQAATIARLNAEWAGKGVRVIHGDAYYSDDAQIALLLQQGETRAAIGQHASIIDTSELMAVNPGGVDLGRLAGLKLTMQTTGIVGDPARASAERGKQLLELRIRAAVQQIRSETAAQ